MPRRTHAGFSFRQVLSGTFSLLLSKRQPLIVAIVTFAMISAVLAAAIERKVESTEDRIASSASMTWKELQTLVNSRVQTFDQADTRVLLHQIKTYGDLSQEKKQHRTSEEASLDFLVLVGPWVVISFIFNLLISFIASVFFLMLAARGKAEALDTLQKLPLMSLRMIFLMLWFLIRSFLWIPLIGPVLAIYMVPRLALSAPLFAGGGIGIFESMQESMKRTSSAWASMFLCLLGGFLVTLALFWFGIVFVAILALFSTKISFFFWLLLLMFLAAFQMFFLAMLTASVG